MPATDATTIERGTPGGIAPVWSWGPGSGVAPGYSVEGLDPNADLRFPLSAPIYHRMRREDGKIGSSFRAVTSPILGARARLVGADVDPAVLRFVETNLGLTPPDGAQVRRRRQGIVWGDHLRQTCLMLAHGFMAFEKVYEVAPVTGQLAAEFPQLVGREFAHLRKLGPRMPHTIAEVRVARDGGLAGIVQYVPDLGQSSGGVPGSVFIPVDDLVWYVNEKEGADWTGQSLFRPAYKHWLIKDTLMRLDAQIAERNGMGIPVVNYDPNTPGAEARALALATGLRSGAESGAALPTGMTLSLVGVSGSTVDVLPKIEYHDRAGSGAMLTQALDLGHDNGARSLGDTFVDILRTFLDGVLLNIEDVTTEFIIRDLVELNFGPEVAYPSLKFDSIAADAIPDAASLKLLTESGLLTGDTETEAWTRSRYGIPAKAVRVDGEQALDDAAGSPVADVGIPALIDAGVISADEGRKMLKLEGRAPGVPAVPGAPPSGLSESDEYLARLSALNERVLALQAQ